MFTLQMNHVIMLYPMVSLGRYAKIVLFISASRNTGDLLLRQNTQFRRFTRLKFLHFSNVLICSHYRPLFRGLHLHCKCFTSNLISWVFIIVSNSIYTHLQLQKICMCVCVSVYGKKYMCQTKNLSISYLRVFIQRQKQ